MLYPPWSISRPVCARWVPSEFSADRPEAVSRREFAAALTPGVVRSAREKLKVIARLTHMLSFMILSYGLSTILRRILSEYQKLLEKYLEARLSTLNLLINMLFRSLESLAATTMALSLLLSCEGKNAGLQERLSLEGIHIDLEKIQESGHLTLTGNHVGNKDVCAILATVHDLRDLNLSYTSIDNDAMRCVRSQSKLEFLDISGTRVDDSGLQHLKNLKSLKIVGIEELMSVSQDGILSLIVELPDLETLFVSPYLYSETFLTELRSEFKVQVQCRFECY